MAKYAQDVIDRQQKLQPEELKGFYQKHRDELTQAADARPISQAMAVVLLGLFEERPERREAIRWLNSAPSAKGEPLEKYLQRWYDAVPQQHKAFVKKVADLYGLPLKAAS